MHPLPLSALRALLSAALALTAASAHAGPVYYTDRASFESALGSFSVDRFGDMAAQGYASSLARPGYTISAPNGGLWRCPFQFGGCGDNSAVGFSAGYIWNYLGADTYSFAVPVMGFGFDYAAPTGYSAGSVLLNGVASPLGSGFYGVIMPTAQTQFVVNQTNSFMLIDNLTTGNRNEVPEPATLLLVGAALLALYKLRPRKNAA